MISTETTDIFFRALTEAFQCEAKFGNFERHLANVTSPIEGNRGGFESLKLWLPMPLFQWFPSAPTSHTNAARQNRRASTSMFECSWKNMVYMYCSSDSVLSNSCSHIPCCIRYGVRMIHDRKR
jgi:hypothetical protein